MLRFPSQPVSRLWIASRDPWPRGPARLIMLLGVVLACPWGSSSAIEPAFKSLRVEQKTNGVPNAQPGQPSRPAEQVITLSEDGTRVRLDDFSPPEQPGSKRKLNRVYILRTDDKKPTILEVWPDGSKYEQYRGDLNKLQRDRDIWEFQIRTQSNSLTRPERDKLMKKYYMKPDGSRDVDVSWGETKDILGKPCKRLLVTENGRTIIDAYISDDVAGGRSFFNLFRRLGAFSTDVLEHIKDIRGLPLQASITVVTKLPAYQLDVEVTKIDEVTTPEAQFRPPSGAKLIKDAPWEQSCPACKKLVEKEAAELVIWKGKRLYFCDADCKKKFMDEAGVPRRRSATKSRKG